MARGGPLNRRTRATDADARAGCAKKIDATVPFRQFAMSPSQQRCCGAVRDDAARHTDTGGSASRGPTKQPTRAFVATSCRSPEDFRIDSSNGVLLSFSLSISSQEPLKERGLASLFLSPSSACSQPGPVCGPPRERQRLVTADSDSETRQARSQSLKRSGSTKRAAHFKRARFESSALPSRSSSEQQPMENSPPATSSPLARAQTTTTASSESSLSPPVLLLTLSAWPLFPPVSTPLASASCASSAASAQEAVLGETTPAAAAAVVSRESSSPPGSGQLQVLSSSRCRQRYMRDDERIDVIRRVQSGEKQSDIAREYGFTRAAICNTYKNRQDILRRIQLQPQPQQPSPPRSVPEATSASSAGEEVCASGSGCGGDAMQSGTGGSSLGRRGTGFQSSSSSSGSGGGFQSSSSSGRSFTGSTTGGSGSSGGGGDMPNPLPALSSLQGTQSRYADTR